MSSVLDPPHEENLTSNQILVSYAVNLRTTID